MFAQYSSMANNSSNLAGSSFQLAVKQIASCAYPLHCLSKPSTFTLHVYNYLHLFCILHLIPPFYSLFLTTSPFAFSQPSRTTRSAQQLPLLLHHNSYKFTNPYLIHFTRQFSFLCHPTSQLLLCLLEPT